MNQLHTFEQDGAVLPAPHTRMPTPARVVLAWGLVLLLMTLTNARLAEVVSPELQRAEVLAGLAAVGLMLVAALWTRADPSQAPRRDLQGDQGLVMHSDVTGIVREELGWGSHMLLTATPAATLLLFWDGEVLLRRGLLSDAPFQPGPICERAMERQATISLVNTTLFPGRGEFDPVLENLPAVLISPLGERGVVILGGWSERCFSKSDEQWLEGWSTRLRTALEQSMTV
ncbi:MAG: cofactor assembly of complex C subunit B [Synechococcus sp.]|nr:cofactor assembly of complex C subunit B [Synechococcus sp.]